MNQQKEEPKKTNRLGSAVVSLILLLLLLAALFVATLVGGLGIVLVGRVLNQVFGLSMFEGALIALGVAFGIVYVLVQVLRPQSLFPPAPPDWDEDDYEDEEWDEDEDEEDWEEEAKDVIIPPHSRNDPCPCGSGRKYKHCHGR